MDLFEAYTAHMDATDYEGPRTYLSRFPADLVAAFESLGVPAVRGTSSCGQTGRFRGFRHVAVRAGAAGMQAAESESKGEQQAGAEVEEKEEVSEFSASGTA